MTRRKALENVVCAVSFTPAVLLAVVLGEEVKRRSERKDFNSDENGRPYGQSYTVPPDITGVDRVLASALGIAGLPALRAEVIVHSRQKK